MAIDAVIERIRPVENGLRLELAPRVDVAGQDSIPGRPSLTILGARSFEPQVGMEIWGSADRVEIVNGPEFDRKGVRLREVRNCPRCFCRMHWASISNTATNESREAWRCGHCNHEEPLP